MNSIVLLITLMIISSQTKANTDNLASSMSRFEIYKTTFNANMATIKNISDTLTASRSTAKAQFDSIFAEKTTATNNIKKYTDQIHIFQQQLAEAQENLKTAVNTVAVCEGKIGNVNTTLGSLAAEKTTSIAAARTGITEGSDGMNKSASSDTEKAEALLAKKQAALTQTAIEALTKEITTDRFKYAVESGSQTRTTSATKAPATPATSPK